MERTDKALLLKKNFAEFFAGIGLVRMGLEQAGWTISFANDIAADKHQMYFFHYGDSPAHFLLEDIHKIKGESIPSVTLATASFPCNDLSLAGRREGLKGKHSSAYWGFVRILGEMGNRKPPLVLIENVAGFLTSHRGKDFESALLALNKLGYSVDPFIIDAANFVPQSRLRLFVVASLHLGKEEIKVAAPPVFYESDARPRCLADFIFHHPEIEWKIRKVPKIPARGKNLESIIENLPEDSPYWWNEERTKYLLSQMSSKHISQLNKMKQQEGWSYGTVFRRIRNGRSMAELRTDGVAGCLRTPRGGSGRQILIKAGNGKVMVRLVTPRECARLMGADDFRIDNSLNRALFGFGDAVCVPVIRWIAINYLNPLVDEMIGKINS